MKNLFLLFITILLIFSCTKEGETISVEGRVYNPLTGEGIEGIELRVFEGTLSGGAPASQSSDSRRIDETFTNEDGIYQLNGVGMGFGATLRLYTSSNKDYYFVGMGDNTITGEFSEFSTVGISSGKHNKVDFWMVPYGTLYTHVQNINCEGESDSMIYRWKAPFKEWTTYWSNWHVGCVDVLYDGEASKQTPMGWHSHEIRVIRNGIETRFFDSIFVYPNEIQTFELNY